MPPKTDINILDQISRAMGLKPQNPIKQIASGLTGAATRIMGTGNQQVPKDLLWAYDLDAPGLFPGDAPVNLGITVPDNPNSSIPTIDKLAEPTSRIQPLVDFAQGAKSTGADLLGKAAALPNVIDDYLTRTDRAGFGELMARSQSTPQTSAPSPTQEAQPTAVPAQFMQGSVFNNSSSPMTFEGIGQIEAPSPFAATQSSNQILVPQLEQDFAQPKPGQAEPGSPQSFFLSQTNNGTTPLSPEKIARGQEYAKQQGLNFDPTTGFSQGTEAPQPQVNGLTTQGGIPLNQFLSGQALPEQGLMRAENPMFGDDSQSRGLSGAPAQEAMAQASADRIARLDARRDFGGGISDRDRRGAGDISKADYDDMAQGMLPGASASERGRALKLGNEFGVDPVTGQPLKSDEGMTFEQKIALRRQKLSENIFEYGLTKDAKELYDKNLVKAKEATSAEAKSAAVGKGLSSSIKDMREVMSRAAGRLDKFFSTDMVGKVASFWKGSSADAQEADFAFLKSNVAINAIMELKANSSTGSTGFGALNTEELKVLTNQFATLDPFTDSKLVRENLKQLNERFEGIIQSAYNTHAAQYGKEAADSVYGSMIGGNQAQNQSNQALSSKPVTTSSGRFTVTAVTD